MRFTTTATTSKCSRKKGLRLSSATLLFVAAAISSVTIVAPVEGAFKMFSRDDEPNAGVGVSRASPKAGSGVERERDLESYRERDRERLGGMTSVSSTTRKSRFPILRALVSSIMAAERDSRRTVRIDVTNASVSITETKERVIGTSISPKSSGSDRSSGSSSAAEAGYRLGKVIADESVNSYEVDKGTNESGGGKADTIDTLENLMDDVIKDEQLNAGEGAVIVGSNTRGFFLTNILSRLMRTVQFSQFVRDMREGMSSRASCLACNVVAGLFVSPLYSKESMALAINTICTTFRLQTPRVCYGIVESFKHDLDYIRKHSRISRDEMCGVLFGMDCARRATEHLAWQVGLPKRTRQPAKQSRQTREKKASTTGKISSVVQITDVHIDPYYVPGTDAACGQPLCCREANGRPVSGLNAAGPWGDYGNCDTPIGTVRHALKHIGETHKDAEYWMWTGDISPHDIWNITKAEVIYQIRLTTDMFKQYSKVNVFPVIGNHEGIPVNCFAPPDVKGEFSIQWLYEAVADEWAFWLPDSALETLRYGGYYTVKVRPGFRIIAINSNYCARLNAWALFDPRDPAGHLAWLAKELHLAEDEGDKVHIIGHVPPDNRECTQAWLHNFVRIVDRFQDTILAQFYGHTHRDEFRLLYSPADEKKVIGMEFIGPSLTPFTENNPAYRVYHMNQEGYLLDHETFFFNLTEANERGESGPVWRREYSAAENLNVTTLGPQGWDDFYQRLATEDETLQYFHKLYYRSSDVKVNEVCDATCRNTMLNDLRVTHALKTKPKNFMGHRKHRSVD